MAVTVAKIQKFLEENELIAGLVARYGIQFTPNGEGGFDINVIAAGAGGGTDPLSASATAKTGVQELTAALNEIESESDEKKALLAALDKPQYITFSTKHIDSLADAKAIEDNAQFETVASKELKVAVTDRAGNLSFIGLIKLNKSKDPTYPEGKGYTQGNYKQMVAEYAVDGDVYMFCYPRDLDPMSQEAMEFYGMLHQWAQEKGLDKMPFPLVDTGADIYGYSQHDAHEKTWEIAGDNKHLITWMAAIYGPDFIQQLSFVRFHEDGSVINPDSLDKALKMIKGKSGIFVNAVGFGLDGQVRGASMIALLEELRSDDINKAPLPPEYFLNLYDSANRSGEISTLTRTTTQLAFLGLAFSSIAPEDRAEQVEALLKAEDRGEAIEAFLKKGFDHAYPAPQDGMRDALKDYLTDTLKRGGLTSTDQGVRYTPKKRAQNSASNADEDRSIPLDCIITQFEVPSDHPIVIIATARAMRARDKQAQQDETAELHKLSGINNVESPQELAVLQAKYPAHEKVWAKAAREKREKEPDTEKQ